MKNIHVFLVETLITIGLIYYSIQYWLQGALFWVLVTLAVMYLLNMVKVYTRLSKTSAWKEKFSFLKGYTY